MPSPYLSVIVPVFNESANVFSTVARAREVLDGLGPDKPYEIILVNDGSTDDTLAQALACAACNSVLRVTGYPVNAGRGKALRTGFAAAAGQFVCSIDADLSYDPKFILDLVAALEAHPEADFAIGSPYMPGGGTEDVPPLRLAISKLGNRVLRWMMPGGFRTFTGIFRCYRRQLLDDLVLESDGKEIHLEILAKAIALGYRGIEVPAVLRGRKKGKSKFRFRKIAQSHLHFGLNEKPMLAFGLVGLLLLLIALAFGIALLVQSATGTPVGGRPITLFTVFLGLAGLMVFAVGFTAAQNVALRNELFKIKRQNVRLAQKVDRLCGMGPAAVEHGQDADAAPGRDVRPR